jgi:hypothetical protein
MARRPRPGDDLRTGLRDAEAPQKQRNVVHTRAERRFRGVKGGVRAQCPWYTTDDDARPGAAFSLDGIALSHRHWYLVPGTVAIHMNATSLTAVHEFQHAASSYSNGQVVDLYTDSLPGLNCKRARPIPASFANYAGTVYPSDLTRDGLGYPVGWQSYHCALHDPTSPAVMDNYYAAVSPEQCQNDTITRQFMIDRLRAKIAR